MTLTAGVRLGPYEVLGPLDGRWIYFNSDRTAVARSGASRAGGTAEQVTHEGGGGAFESFDGRTLNYEAGRALRARPIARGPERTIVRCVNDRSYAVPPTAGASSTTAATWASTTS